MIEELFNRFKFVLFSGLLAFFRVFGQFSHFCHNLLLSDLIWFVRHHMIIE